MEACDENIIEKCRICDISVTDGDFVPLFTTSCHNIERTHSGELFDELIQLPSAEDPNYPYICNGCDLQMKLFKRLKDKAWKRITAKVDTSEFTIELSDTDQITQNSEHEEGFSGPNSIVCEVENENNNYISYIESTVNVNENQSNDAVQEDNIDNNILIVYNMKGQSVQSVNVDDLIEIENSIGDENTVDGQEEYPLTPEAQNETQSVQVHEMFNSSKNTTENSLRSTKTECKDCGLILSSMRSLKVHRQEQHGRTHLCKICQKMFKTADNLEGHMRQHSGLAPYQCETCNKTFNQKVHYQYHMKRHKNERDFACNLCDKSFFNKSDLTMHIKRTHEGEKKFVCSFQNCGKRFYFEQHLQYHSYVHGGQRNFHCDQCRQRFVAPNALALHKRTIHSASIRFECAQCGKTFRRKHHLEAHSSTHGLKIERTSSRDNHVLNRKVKILKSNLESKFSGLKDIQRDGVDEIDESPLQAMNDQSDDNEFLMDVIESCSEADNQIETDNYTYC